MMEEDEMENVKAGMHMTYDQAKVFHKFNETKHNKPEELDEEELEGVRAGMNISYEQAKEMYEQNNKELEENENTKSR